MFCSWCGLESETSDVCSWCRKPFAPQSETPSGEQPQSASAAQVADKASPSVAPAKPPLEAIPIKKSDPAPAVIPIAPQSPIAEPEDLPPLPRSPQPLRPLAQPLGEFDDDIAPLPGPIRPLEPVTPPVGPPAAKATQAAGTVTVARTSRGYYCRWCGLDSETPDRCSWCRKEMLPMVPSHRLGAPARPVRGRTTHPQPPLAHANGGAAAAAPVAGVPTLGTFTAAKSRYYADKVYDPVSGTHYDADSGQAEIGDVEPLETEEVNIVRQLVYNVTFLVVLTVIGIALVRANSNSYLLVLGVSNFLAGIAMPLFRTVEFAEDDSADLPLALALILILGPLVGAILYAFICMAKQGNWTPGVGGVFVSYLVLRIALDAALGIKFDTLFPWNDVSMQTISAQLMPIATIVGWLAAYPFHKHDES